MYRGILGADCEEGHLKEGFQSPPASAGIRALENYSSAGDRV
jgi:hypothetical protein